MAYFKLAIQYSLLCSSKYYLNRHSNIIQVLVEFYISFDLYLIWKWKFGMKIITINLNLEGTFYPKKIKDTLVRSITCHWFARRRKIYFSFSSIFFMYAFIFLYIVWIIKTLVYVSFLLSFGNIFLTSSYCFINHVIVSAFVIAPWYFSCYNKACLNK